MAALKRPCIRRKQEAAVSQHCCVLPPTSSYRVHCLQRRAAHASRRPFWTFLGSCMQVRSALATLTTNTYIENSRFRQGTAHLVRDEVVRAKGGSGGTALGSQSSGPRVEGHHHHQMVALGIGNGGEQCLLGRLPITSKASS